MGTQATASVSSQLNVAPASPTEAASSAAEPQYCRCAPRANARVSIPFAAKARTLAAGLC